MPAFSRHLPRRHHLLHRLPKPALHTYEAHRGEYRLGVAISMPKAEYQQRTVGYNEHRYTFGRRRAGNALHACPQAALLPQQHQSQKGPAGAAGKDRALPGRK